MTQISDPVTTHHQVAGKPTLRQDALNKLSGRTRYAGDLTAAGLLHARLVLSPYAHARILSIDTAPALKIPGVAAVYTAKTLGLAHPDGPSRSKSPLAVDEVCWSGHPVAIVLAETEEAALDGASAVDVEYEPLPVVVDPVAALAVDAPLSRLHSEDAVSEIAGGGAHAAVGGGEAVDEPKEALSKNVSDTTHLKAGDIEEGLRAADVTIEFTYKTSPVHQSYMEPQSITVVPSVSGHEMTVWASSQGMFGVREDISEALNLDETQVHVESVPIGGAFGGKFGLIEPLAAAAALASHKPVRLVYTRQEDLLAGNPAPQSVITLKLGAKKDGTLVALQAKAIMDSGSYPGASAGLAAYILSSTYRCPNVDIRGYEVLTNKVGVGAYRAPNAPQATFALESTVAELCKVLDMDGIEFRKLNALREGDAAIDGRRGGWPRIGLIECLEAVQQHPLWTDREAQKASSLYPETWKIGIGLAAGGWPGGTEPAASACRIEKDGTFTVVVGSVDLTGSDTSLALIAAEVLGMSSDSVRVRHDSTDTMPYSGGTGGSKTIYSMGSAVLDAARDARKQVLDIASEMLEASPEDLELTDGHVSVKGAPSKSVELKKIAQASMRYAGRFEPIYGRGRSANRTSSPMYAAHLAKVGVDTETGEVHVLDYVAAQDVGFAINPAEVEGQIHGGVTQGIGWALFEGLVYDNEGQLLTSTLMDYALPLSKDVPTISTLLVQVPSSLGPFGAKGVGEPPVVPVAAAIANAIDEAIGVRLTHLPMRPERVYTALNQK